MSSIDAFRRNLRLAVEASAIEVATTAKMQHRYKQQNGRLKDAVQTTINDDGREGRVYLDGNIAPYAVFIHEGIKPHDIFPSEGAALGRREQIPVRKARSLPRMGRGSVFV